MIDIVSLLYTRVAYSAPSARIYFRTTTPYIRFLTNSRAERVASHKMMHRLKGIVL